MSNVVLLLLTFLLLLLSLPPTTPASLTLTPRKSFDNHLLCRGPIPSRISLTALSRRYPSLLSFCGPGHGYPSVGLICPSLAGPPEWSIDLAHRALSSDRLRRYCLAHCWCLSDDEVPPDEVSFVRRDWQRFLNRIWDDFPAPPLVPDSTLATAIYPRPHYHIHHLRRPPPSYLVTTTSHPHPLQKRHGFTNPLDCHGRLPEPSLFPPSIPATLYPSLTALCAAYPSARPTLGFACAPYSSVPVQWLEYRSSSFKGFPDLGYICRQKCRCPTHRVGGELERPRPPPRDGGAGLWRGRGAVERQRGGLDVLVRMEEGSGGTGGERAAPVVMPVPIRDPRVRVMPGLSGASSSLEGCVVKGRGCRGNAECGGGGEGGCRCIVEQRREKGVSDVGELGMAVNGPQLAFVAACGFFAKERRRSVVAGARVCACNASHVSVGCCGSGEDIAGGLVWE